MSITGGRKMNSLLWLLVGFGIAQVANGALSSAADNAERICRAYQEIEVSREQAQFIVASMLVELEKEGKIVINDQDLKYRLLHVIDEIAYMKASQIGSNSILATNPSKIPASINSPA